MVMDHPKRFHDRRAHGDRRPPREQPGRRPAPEESTQEEVKYIKHLIENQVPVCVKLIDNQEVTGVIEYYDQSFIRVTRQNQPNLFIFKDKIKYLYELKESLYQEPG